VRIRNHGFTLLELSVVLVLIGIIIGGGLMTFTASVQATQFNKTVERMDAIEKALLNYAIANNRIPCPTDLTLTATGSANYGVEAGAGSGSSPGTATGACTGASMLPKATFVAASGTAEGGVPTRALQLPDDFMYDGWGRKFRYAVDPTYTKTAALPAPASSPCNVSSTSPITVNDATGAARTTAGMYALISHGANGHGAYTSNGVTLNAGSSSANELTNCHCTSAGVYSGSYTPTYIEKAPQYDSGETGIAAYYFDDIVTFKEPWQMQAQNYPLSQTAAQCVYVSDYGNGRVEVFNTSGSYISQFGSVGWGGNGQFEDPFGITIDRSGNIWVVDSDNDRVQEFNSSGSYLSQFGSGGTVYSNGQFSVPRNVAIDGSGNFWVTDAYNNRVQKLNSSGSWVLTIPSGCPDSDVPACPSGTGNGQFNNPDGIAIDSSGNIWVTDYNNNRVEEFSSSGSFLMGIGAGYSGVSGTIGSSGTGNGQFNAPNGISIDSSGNVWVADLNSRVQEFNSSGTYLNQLGNGSNGCGLGQLNNPISIAFDASGNAWVTDWGCDRVEEFTSSGTYLSVFGGSYGSGNGQFNGLTGIAIGNR
jgi:prepilin-type N-terminal cleavage/methylation domain-containing protein